MTGIIFDVREFAVHDGPGIRTTVFLKGCPLRCAWCHNPEGQSFEPEAMIRKASCTGCGNCKKPCAHEECRPFGVCLKACLRGLISIAGEKAEARELALRLKKQGDFLRGSGGGVTVSGGEPLAQPEFLFELLEELKPLHTAIETSGYAPGGVFRQAAELADLMLIDIKHVGPEAHRALTGRDNAPIIANLAWLIESGRPFVARVPLIPGANDSLENMEATAALLKGAPGLISVELLPYNTFAGAKYAMVGRRYDPGFDEKAKPRFYTEAFGKYNIPCRVL